MSYRDITRPSVLDAIAEYDQLGEFEFLSKYGFDGARAYHLSHKGRLYPSKAIVGVAHGYAMPDIGPLRSHDFTGGAATVKRKLENLGFKVVVQPQDLATGYQDVLGLEGVPSERQRREEIWKALVRSGGPIGIAPRLLRDLHIYGGAQGVWVDKQRTKGLGPYGATVGLLHTGSSYADDLTEDAVLYHYPMTNRSKGRDAAEVEATKTAGRLELPVFVITYPTPGSQFRNVHKGWVTDWDDESGEFLVIFGKKPVAALASEPGDDDNFTLTAPGGRRSRSSRSYDRDPQFKFKVFKRYGPQCSVCGMAVKEVLQAAHIRGKKDKGSDDPRNGLVLCATHHVAFDAGLFDIEPKTFHIRTTKHGPPIADLGIEFPDIQHLRRLPHADAIAWRYKRRSKSV